ncbi:MAG TPA: Fe(3+) ABC transporter substrate-binding protein [Gemmatimonadaceae bacterium]|nr:Fe(3+) ABC transporter substrate-binding protein [Gemmatimonadaceae bacterium]
MHALRRSIVRLAAPALALLAAACAGGADTAADTTGAAANAGAGGVVNVYSHRHYDADREVYRRFTEQTGIDVNVVTASADELITRLENEGAGSPADVIITVDAGRLHRAKTRGLLQPVESAVLDANVPEHLRDRDRQWFGITQRARILVHHASRVQPSELSTYAALAEPKWAKRVAIRSSSNVYNQSLLASIIAHDGPEAATRWATGIVRALARTPSGGDTDQIKAVAAGTGDVAVVNSYYLARLIDSENPEDRRVAEQVRPFFPNQDGRGTHVNVSGAAVTRHAPNRENAIRFIEFLSGDEAQRLFAESNGEYPVKPGVPWPATLKAWGEFKADTLDLTRLGELNDEAVRIADRAGWR